MFITIEGIDCSGKSTQCRLLAEFLTGRGFDVLLLREPGDTKISEKIRNILLDKGSSGMKPLTEFLLYSAARAQLVEEVIRPALAEGKTVICDRFYDSSTAYQGFGRKLDVENIELINGISTGKLEPDLTIVIDIPVEILSKRQKLAGKTADRIESEGFEFLNAVREGFLQISTHQKDRVKVVNGSDDINTIRRKIQDVVSKKFNIK